MKNEKTAAAEKAEKRPERDAKKKPYSKPTLRRLGQLRSAASNIHF